MGKVCTCW